MYHSERPTGVSGATVCMKCMGMSMIRGSMLPCVAVRCGVLRCVAVCCSVLQCAVCYSVQCVALSGDRVCRRYRNTSMMLVSVLQCVTECCTLLQRVAVCYSVLRCQVPRHVRVAVCCRVLYCVAVCCSVL